MGKPVYLQVKKQIPHPLQKVWETVALGFGNVADYNPEIKASRFETEQREGVGTQRHCDFNPKGYIKEEIIEWEDQKSFKLKFIETSVPMGFLESKFTFQQEGDNTLITQEFWYRMKPPMGWLSGLMKGKMMATLESGLNGLEKHLNNQ